MSEMTRLTRRDLESRGWSRRMIKLLLEPCAATNNPLYPNGPIMHLYDLDEAEKAEGTDQWQEMNHRTKSHSDKLYSSNKWAKNVRINLMENIEVLALAESLGTQDGQAIVTFIRHRFSNYDKLMDICDKKAGPNEIKRVIRLRLLRKISKTYPGLRAGCKRQWTKWYREDLAF